MSSAGSTKRLAEGLGASRADLLRSPDETGLRFTLLVGAALAASVFVGSTIYFSVRGPVMGAALARCGELVGPPPLAGPELPAWVTRLDACQAGVRAEMLAWSVGWVVIVVVTAFSVYAVIPAWKIRRRHLRSLHRVEDLQDYVAGLCAESGLRTPPRLVGDPLDSSTTALAFGGWGRRLLALQGGMIRLFSVDRPAFRAIVLHELAHLRNRDVGRTYYAVSVWLAFLAVGLLPFVVVTVLSDAARYGLASSWRILLLAGLVYLTRNALLRSRELYADARAGITEPEAALATVLRRLSPIPRWRAGVGVHPSPELRLRALTDPVVVLRPALGEALALGVVTSVLYAAVTGLVTLVAELRPSVQWWGALVVSPLAVGILGLIVWRYTVAVGVVRSVGRTVTLGLAFGCGLLIGEAVSVFGASSATGPVAPWFVAAPGQPSVIAFGLPWVGAVLASSAFFTWWLGASAAAWRDLGPTGRRGVTVTLSLVAAGFVWVVWLGALFALRDGSAVIGDVSAQWTAVRERISAVFWAGPLPVWVLLHPLVDDVLVQPLVGATFIVLWGLPLVALLIRSRRAGRQASSIRYAVLAGIVAGLAFLPLLLALRLVLRSILAPELRAVPQLADALFVWTLVLALSVQIVASVVVAAQAKELAVAHALLAASISALLMAAGALGATVIASCAHVFAVRVDPATCGEVLPGLSDAHMAVQFMVGGALFVIPAAMVTQAVTRRNQSAPSR
jgi:Zn-dependent protease with chaperone function